MKELFGDEQISKLQDLMDSLNHIDMDEFVIGEIDSNIEALNSMADLCSAYTGRLNEYKDDPEETKLKDEAKKGDYLPADYAANIVIPEDAYEFGLAEEEFERKVQKNIDRQDIVLVSPFTGARFVKCELCGEISNSDEFVTYGGRGHLNSGICRTCSSKNKSAVLDHIKMIAEENMELHRKLNSVD